VDLGCCYDVDGLKARRSEIETHMANYKAAYCRAYRALRAEQEVRQTEPMPPYHEEKLTKRTKGIIRRELGKRGDGSGSVTKRFLGGPTCKGDLCRHDTVVTLAKRVYLLCGSRRLAGEMLAQIAAAAAARNYDVIFCPDPEEMSRPQHIIIPSLALAFLTGQEEVPYPGRPYRRIHLDALVMKRKENRAKERFCRRTAALLHQEGMEELRQAKAHHDLLEQVYNPYVDFTQIYDLAEKEWQRIKKQLEST
jgi:hypothetical protein